jgi:hypothetical protein
MGWIVVTMGANSGNEPIILGLVSFYGLGFKFKYYSAFTLLNIFILIM